MNMNQFVARAMHFSVRGVLNHLEVSWCSRDIKTVVMECVYFAVKIVVKYSLARVFYICVYACVVKIVHSSVVVVGNPVAKMV